MLGWLLAGYLLQAGSVPASACTDLAACLREVDQAARVTPNGAEYRGCDALRQRLLAYGGTAKQALLERARSDRADERNVAGCLLMDWPDWTQADLPALTQAVEREEYGGWIVRALRHFPDAQALPLLAKALQSHGRFDAANQAGAALGQRMPGSLMAAVAYFADAPQAEQDAVVVAISEAIRRDADREKSRRLLVGVAASNSAPPAQRRLALAMLADAGIDADADAERARLRSLARATDPALRFSVRRTLWSVHDVSMLDEEISQCLPEDTHKAVLDEPGVGAATKQVVGDRTLFDCMRWLQALGPRAVPATARVLPYLQAESWRARVGAAETLGLIADRAVAVHLHALLKDRDWQVVAAAVHAEVRLGDRAAVPLLRELAGTHWYAAIRELATSAIAAIDAGRPKGLDDAFQDQLPVWGSPAMVRIVPDLLWGDPLAMPATVCPLPGNSEAPARLVFAEGVLSGTDHGEFGGELSWQPSRGGAQILEQRNVTGMLQVGKHTALVVTGLAHMGSDRAALYRVAILPGGRAQSTRLMNMPVRASDLQTDGTVLFYRSRAGSFRITPHGPEVTVQALDCPAAKASQP